MEKKKETSILQEVDIPHSGTHYRDMKKQYRLPTLNPQDKGTNEGGRSLPFICRGVSETGV